MRMITKSKDSILQDKGWKYVSGDTENNRHIRDILLAEQEHICSYTEIHLGRAVKAEIDHFNPKLKDRPADGYENWYAVSGQWNNEKAAKWDNHQPVMHPTDTDLEKRIVYDNGDYLIAIRTMPKPKIYLIY